MLSVFVNQNPPLSNFHHPKLKPAAPVVRSFCELCEKFKVMMLQFKHYFVFSTK